MSPRRRSRSPRRRPRSWSPPPKSEVERAEEKFNETQKASSELFTTGKEINAVPFSRPGEALETGSRPRGHAAQRRGQGQPVLSCAASISITAPISRSISTACRSTCAPMATARAMRTPISSSRKCSPMSIARKGPYNVEDGDFSSAGTIRMQYMRKVPQGCFRRRAAVSTMAASSA